MTAAARSSSLARLEYGKLCQSRDGPILKNSEVGVLARSADFPRSLVAVCRPPVFGLTEGTIEIDAARSFGEVLLVMGLWLPSRAVARVAARFRRRGEEGEGSPGRSFWRARFLYSADGADDIAALAMELMHRPLSGWTAADSIDSLPVSPPRHASVAGAMTADVKLDQWCARAGSFILKGIPVGIRAPFSREAFFKLAGMLQEAIPPEVRQLFSAGWGLNALQASSVALSCCSVFPPSIAVYDPASHQWVSERPQAPRRAGSEQIGRNRLLPFNCAEVQSILCASGSRVSDEQTLRVLRRWLSSNDDGMLPASAALAWSTSTGLRRALDTLRTQLLNPQRCGRSERVLVALLRGPSGAEAIAWIDTATDCPLLAIIVALVHGDAMGALAALSRISEPLPPWTRSRLDAALDQTLAPVSKAAIAHGLALTNRRGLAPEYVSWAARNARTLALILGSLAPPTTREHALLALRIYSQAPEAALIYQVLYGTEREVTPDTVALAMSMRTVVVRLALRRWGSLDVATANERSAALRWLLALGAPPDDPIVGHQRPTEAEVADIAHALIRDCVPEELIGPLAERVLRFWPLFRSEVTQRWQVWSSVLARWPGHIEALLVTSGRLDSIEPSDTFVDVALAPLPSASELEEMGLRVVAKGAFDGEHGAACAALYLDWCLGAKPPHQGGGVLEAIIWLWRGGVASEPPYNAPVANVVGAVAARVAPPPEQQLMRWRTSRTSGGVLLLVHAFGGPIEEPSVEKLELLMERGEELATLMSASRDMRWKDALSLCTAEWQGFDFLNATAPWRREFCKTRLSGLFARLPRDAEAPIPLLLGFFSRRFGRHPWDLGLTYLGRRGDLTAADDTKMLLWKHIVECACVMTPVNAEQFAKIVEYSEDGRMDPRAIVDAVDYLPEPVVVLRDATILLHRTFAVLLRALGDPALSAKRRQEFSDASA